MYTVVFVTRYLNLLSPFSLYLIIMKLFFIASSCYILYLMKVEYKYVADGSGACVWRVVRRSAAPRRPCGGTS